MQSGLGLTRQPTPISHVLKATHGNQVYFPLLGYNFWGRRSFHGTRSDDSRRDMIFRKARNSAVYPGVQVGSPSEPVLSEGCQYAEGLHDPKERDFATLFGTFLAAWLPYSMIPKPVYLFTRGLKFHVGFPSFDITCFEGF